jgi:hypothetical protein
MRRRLAILCVAACCGASVSISPGEASGPRIAALAADPIRGVCGGPRLADAVARGANTVRTYAAPSIAELDRYQALGLRVIVGHWMPHEGTNVGKEGWPWEHSYEATADRMDREFAAIVDRIGGHPSIAMWGLGNEVRLEPRYLRQVDRLSRILHERHPGIPTSLTMVNAPADDIALVREHAPDLDVLGVNSYGQGAVGNAIAALQERWGRPFYFSEFGPNGPWWGPQASWGPRFEEGASAKNADLAKAWERIAAADGCLGGCAFLWGRWPRERISYFSMLLTRDPWSPAPVDAEHRFTPLADELARAWKGSAPRRPAPHLERLEINGLTQRDIVVEAGAMLAVAAARGEQDADPVRYRWWIAHETSGGFQPLVGPVDTDCPSAALVAPRERGAPFFLFCLALDDGEGACAATLPFKTAD